MSISLKFLKKLPLLVTFCSILQGSNAGILGDALRSINDDYTWSIEDTMGVGVKVADYHYRWGNTVLRRNPYPLNAVENKKEEPWGGRHSILSGQISDRLFHVEWISMNGVKYNVNIPVRKLIEKNNLSYKKRLDIKAYLKAEDEYVIEAKDESNQEYIEIYNSKTIKDDPEDLKKFLNTINQSWFNMNMEIPPDFDSSTLTILSCFDNSGFSDIRYQKLRIKNNFKTSIRSGQTLIPSLQSLYDNYKIKWTSPVSQQEVSYAIPLKKLITEKGLDDVKKKPNIYNYSHEILVRVLPDDNLEMLLTPKEEFKPFTSAEVLIYSSKDTGRE